MRVVVAAAITFMAAIPSAHGQSYQPSFEPSQFKRSESGRANEVLVLGSPHLSDASSTIGPSMLDPLLDKLAAWHPTAIATEDLSGLQCDALRRYPARYSDTIETYCFDPSAAGGATGLDVPAANAEAERVLTTWPTSPKPADRRHLAAVFMAAGEPNSALVQWLRLPETERHAGDGLTPDLATALAKRENARSEAVQIGARLAARLGLDRVWSVDDHSADTPNDPDPAVNKAYSEAMAKVWDNPYMQQQKAENARLDLGLSKPGGILAKYRDINAPRASIVTFKSDFGAALEEPSRQQFGRNYVGWWETRNLRMVSNIRDVLGRYPGTRMLAIVGSSHKGYYEAYLNQMTDVRLADVENVLK